MKNSLIFAIVGLVAVVCLPVSSAGAAEVTIVNPGFEDPVLAEDDWTWQDVPGWTPIGHADDDEGVGVWNTTIADFDPVIAPGGENVLYTEYYVGGVGGVAQILGAKFAADTAYTLTVEVGDSYYYYFSGYKVQLLAGGTVIAEDNDTLWPPYYEWATSTVAYTYDPADSALVGQPLEIRLLSLGLDKDGPGVDDPIGVEFDNVTLTTADDPTAPFVDAGVDMITWSGKAVQSDPNVKNNDVTPLTYLWTAAPDDGVVFDPNVNPADPNTSIDEEPNVTITKATDNPSIVELTLAVNNEGKLPEEAVKDTMTIDVYDDACAAARLGAGLTHEIDLDGNCIINFGDFALMATTWLDDTSLTGPVPK